jgi:hypothetical protein
VGEDKKEKQQEHHDHSHKNEIHKHTVETKRPSSDDNIGDLLAATDKEARKQYHRVHHSG